MLVPYSWLKEYIEPGLSPANLAAKITMGGVEVESVSGDGDDAVLHLAPTPNRGDMLALIGVAKEVAALLGAKVKLPSFKPPKGSGAMSDFVEVIVRDIKASPRYTSRVIGGVKIGPSPAWLRRRVESAGIRSINNVVDATNFVMMETGQPVHAFDLRFLKGGKLIIDKPKSPCRLKTLDGNEYEFTPSDILNMDAERAIGAAGIMGGENSGVADDTKTLVLESAYFNPTMVRRASKRTGLASESSKRFEKGVDPEGVINALHRLTSIIVEVAGGMPSADWVDLYPKKIVSPVIDLSVERVNWILGTDIKRQEVVKILKSLGCNIRDGGGKAIKVLPPSHRPDLTRPIDLIEEVARLYGYESIRSTLPQISMSSLSVPETAAPVGLVRDQFVANGFFEVVTYSFASQPELETFGGGRPAIKVKNPLTDEMGFMRTTLVPSLLNVIAYNLRRQTFDLKIFEVGRVYIGRGGDAHDEVLTLAGAMTGRRRPGAINAGKEMLDILDAKASVWSVFSRLGIPAADAVVRRERSFLHPGGSFDILLSGRDIGWCGRLHPSVQKRYDIPKDVYIFELDLGAVLGAYLSKKIVYKPISRFPGISRDVALLLDSGVTYEKLLHSFKKNVNKLVQSVELFDIYEGEELPSGKKSMAYRIYFASSERTLSDEEVDRAMSEIIEGVKKEIGAEVR